MDRWDLLVLAETEKNREFTCPGALGGDSSSEAEIRSGQWTGEAENREDDGPWRAEIRSGRRTGEADGPWRAEH
jgi:hypothetical protein